MVYTAKETSHHIPLRAHQDLGTYHIETYLLTAEGRTLKDTRSFTRSATTSDITTESTSPVSTASTTLPTQTVSANASGANQAQVTAATSRSASVTVPQKPNRPAPSMTLTGINQVKDAYTLTIQTDKSVVSIDVQAWSKADKSNIKIYQLVKTRNNTYTLTINLKDHQNARGIFQNRVITNYADGTSVTHIAPTADLSQAPVQTQPTPPAKKPVTSSATFAKAGFFNLSLQNAETGSYRFAVWSDKNGQDDLKWYTAAKDSTGNYKHLLDLSKHKDSGLYHFHIYKEVNGKLTGILASSFTVETKHLPVVKPAPKPTPVPTIPKTYVPTYYPIGECTWGVKQVAPWVGEYWGNAGQWITSAKSNGHTVGTTPRVGAVAVWPNDAYPYGHVGIVTHVESHNRIQILESNFNGNRYIGNFRGWFNPNQIWNGYTYIPETVYYIYPNS